jgi:hypothetical protein
MNEKGTGIHPFYRALVGAGFAFGIGTVAILAHSFWVAVLLTIMVVVGAVVGVLAISGD